VSREGRSRPSLFAFVLVAIGVLGGCVRQSTPSSDAGPPKDLGRRAVFATTTTTTTTTADAPSTTTAPAGTSPASGRGASAATTTTVAGPGRSREGTGSTTTTGPAKPLGGSVTDAADDNGLEAPDYADVVTVALEDTGADLRATVTFAAALPRTLAEGEVMGVGIDLFRSNARESDYQLFATGRADGWTAYLDTADGFVKYPGTFTVAGPTLVFRIPWSTVGGHAPATFSSFADWSHATVALVARTGQDSAPDRGTAPLA
jgi:hypothetical protein